MYQFAINTLQPLAAVLLICLGNAMLILAGLDWIFSTRLTEELTRIFMTTLLTAMILITAGVFLARW